MVVDSSAEGVHYEFVDSGTVGGNVAAAVVVAVAGSDHHIGEEGIVEGPRERQGSTAD
jgi:hypothetical protein